MTSTFYIQYMFNENTRVYTYDDDQYALSKCKCYAYKLYDIYIRLATYY